MNEIVIEHIKLFKESDTGYKEALYILLMYDSFNNEITPVLEDKIDELICINPRIFKEAIEKEIKKDK